MVSGIITDSMKIIITLRENCLTINFRQRFHKDCENRQCEHFETPKIV